MAMPGNYLPTEYLAILLMFVFALGFGVVSLWVGRFFRLRRSYKEKLLAYESGNLPSGSPRLPFSVKFYLVAILFMVFDVEAIFLYPWAVSFDRLGLTALVEMFIFIALLLVGYIYAWKKGALQWER